MVGGGIKRDDGLPALSSTNIFSALESRRRKSSKKRSNNEKSDSAKDSSLKQFVPQVWTPTPVSVKSWADCEDDDDFFATPALPLPSWASDQPTETVDVSREDVSQGEESEGDDEVEEEGDEANEEEPGTEAIDLDGNVKSAPITATTAREPDRQLSKKELKKKELAELEAVLAELGLNPKDEDDSREFTDNKNEGNSNGQANGQVENLGIGGSVLAESKSSKRRKAKKEKSFKGRDEEVSLETDGISKEDLGADDVEAHSGTSDPKEVLKKLASMKKKKSFKESDGASKAAAAEAAARAARLAAAKKKEKSHYNQQPVR